MAKKKVAIYTRVSTNKEEQVKSIKTQEEIYTEYCEQHGYELYKIYPEEGRTGTNSRRPQFKQLLYDGGVDFELNPLGNDIFNSSTRIPKFDIVLCKDVSRWSRNASDGKAAVERLLHKGVHMIFENSGVSTFKDDWELSLSLQFTMAQNESRSMGQRIKRTKKYNALKGKYSPSRIPYGFMRLEDNSIVINESEAKVVRLIFDRYLEVGGNIISNELNELGISSQTGAKWSNDKVTRIIQNKIYYGTATVNKTFKLNVTDTRRSKANIDEHIEIPNVVDPIVSHELWIKTNEIRLSRINKNKKVGRKPARNDKYYGRLICGECGSRLVRHTGYGGKIIYICQKRRKGHGCNLRSISINILDRKLADVELKNLRSGMTEAVYYKKLNKLIGEQKSNLTSTKLKITTEIEALEEDNKSTLKTIKKEFKENNNPTIREMLMEDIEDNKKKIDELNGKLKKLSFTAIEHLQDKVENKRELIEGLYRKKLKTESDKLTLLKHVEVKEYELDFNFALPSYEEEVELYNSLFDMSPMKKEVSFRPFTANFKRDHKEAKMYWNEIDEAHNV